MTLADKIQLNKDGFPTDISVCLKCETDISDHLNFEELGQEFPCSNCGNVMVVQFDELFDQDASEVDQVWWVEQPEETS